MLWDATSRRPACVDKSDHRFAVKRGPLKGGNQQIYYCRTYMKAVRGGGSAVKRGDVCYGMLRAAACVDESDHHALVYVWHGQEEEEEEDKL